MSYKDDIIYQTSHGFSDGPNLYISDLVNSLRFKTRDNSS